MQSAGFKRGNFNCVQQIPVPSVPPFYDHSHNKCFYILNHSYFLVNKGTPNLGLHSLNVVLSWSSTAVTLWHCLHHSTPCKEDQLISRPWNRSCQYGCQMTYQWRCHGTLNTLLFPSLCWLVLNLLEQMGTSFMQ